jgi:hypothetical protein
MARRATPQQSGDEVGLDLLHAQPAEAPHQGEGLLPGTERSICRLINESYLFDGWVSKLKRKLESNADEVSESVTSVRRIELITGAGRRRGWSSDEKARIVMESLRPGANVSEVARRNGLSPQQLFAWRRKARALFKEDTAPTPADRLATAPVSGSLGGRRSSA